jgi:outer membrane protein TolC
MKRILIIIINYSLLIINSTAQDNLSLQKAYELAQQNYPLIKQRELIKQTTGLTLENLGKGFLPQFALNAQATYQSAVTEPKITAGGAFIEVLSKDQYKILADVNQLIYDGGTIKQQKNIQQLNEDAEVQKLEVELYKLKDRINQIFFGVLFLEEQMKQVDLVVADLNTGIKKVEAQVNNGTTFRSNLHLLKAEQLKAGQRLIELRSSRKGLIDILSIFVNQPLQENIKLERPQVSNPGIDNEILRPELKWYSTQEKLLGGQYQLVNSRNRPKASLFFQGGYGLPGLNMFINQFDFFYTTGIRFNWSFGGLYTQKRDKKIIELNQKTVDVQKEVFLFNTNTQLKQEQSEIEKLQKLLDSDKEIVELRIKVKDAAKAQLENGVITANDYLLEVNAEDQARQNLITHQVQLLQAVINYQTITGKQ